MSSLATRRSVPECDEVSISLTANDIHDDFVTKAVKNGPHKMKEKFKRLSEKKLRVGTYEKLQIQAKSRQFKAEGKATSR
jgi:hypothetical protein